MAVIEYARGRDCYHQQYLSDSENPNGYCNHGPNGLSCPIGIGNMPSQTSIEVPGAAH
jgi:peptide-methionine (S)-S-oxide reductase